MNRSADREPGNGCIAHAVTRMLNLELAIGAEKTPGTNKQNRTVRTIRKRP